MATLVEALRPFRIAGLEALNGPCDKVLRGWICDEDFQVYNSFPAGAFELAYSDAEPVVRAYAAEISRISIACYESLTHIAPVAPFQRSSAWLVIKSYYSAFFAAHALLRILGTSCDSLSKDQIRSIERIAGLYGFPPDPPLKRGLHLITLGESEKAVKGCGVRSAGNGPHEAFWNTFGSRMREIISQILMSQTLSIEDAQEVAAKLTEMLDNLSYEGSPRFSWLSQVRIAVNYDQRWATWFPYAGRPKYYNQLFDMSKEWRRSPTDIDLTNHNGEDLRRFQATCSFLIAVAHQTILDIDKRNGGSHSFLREGPISLLKRLTP